MRILSCLVEIVFKENYLYNRFIYFIGVNVNSSIYDPIHKSVGFMLFAQSYKGIDCSTF